MGPEPPAVCSLPHGFPFGTVSWPARVAVAAGSGKFRFPPVSLDSPWLWLGRCSRRCGENSSRPPEDGCKANFGAR
jgi:hypothetical protein